MNWIQSVGYTREILIVPLEKKKKKSDLVGITLISIVSLRRGKREESDLVSGSHFRSG